MKITVNGKEEEVKAGLTIVDYLESKDLEAGRVVIEYNGQVIKQDKWEQIELAEDDNLEILNFVGGGQ
ncbi:sulfur carrier protein ThiS [Natroniella sulfidigena]|uniref:sulfur carrier protein ThiS n=1 Tax=Natroniella sulfidigena TaxID=723921 RepID=UPI00200B3AE3|nr:sulfur carrier protein ThiS [Natroniella sulfidigena]MCK8816451.1 sulfur carrier protein ThiS [Natroniella sulfidigena]